MHSFDTLKQKVETLDSIKATKPSIAEKQIDRIETIKAIGSTWPFVVVIFIIVVVILKWKYLWSKLDKTSKLEIAGQKLEFIDERKFEEEKSKVSVDAPTTEAPKIENEDRPDFIKIYGFLSNKKYPEAETLFLELQKGTEDDTERQINTINYIYYKYLFGVPEAQAELIAFKEKVTAKDVLSHYHYILGRCYFNGESYDKAILELNSSLKLKYSNEKIRIIWESKFRMGRKNEAYEYILDQIANASSSENKAELYFQLSEHFDREKDELKKALALEKAIELNPNNTDWLFRAAYSYSQVGINLIAANHYIKRNTFNTDGTTLNNLGVSFSKLGLYGKAVEEYKKSAEQGETLAASNLAYLLTDKGFFEDADLYIQKAIKSEEINNNVWSAKEHLESKRKEEADALEKIKKSNTEQILFLRSFGAKFFSREITQFTFKAGLTLKSNDGATVEIKPINDKVNLTWRDNNQVNHEIEIQLTGESGFAKYKALKDNYFGEHYKNYETGFYIVSPYNFSFLFYGDEKYIKIELLCSWQDS